MTRELLPVVVPALTEGLLLVMCLLVWRRLRTLGLDSVCRWVLTAIVVDACGQVWHLSEHFGKPAGAAWLLHVSLSYLMVYVLHRLGELLWQTQKAAWVAQEGRRRLLEEGVRDHG